MDIIKSYFPSLTEMQINQLNLLSEGITDWNSKINLISRKEMDEIEERHILHSLSIAKFITFSKGTEIIDVGTGGGFPGLPLAIVFPECRFTLVDSIGKKIRVVNELIELTGLKNVITKNCRAESVNEKYDFVVSRAVTAFPTFYSWTRSLVRKSSKNEVRNGIIALKGGDLREEMADFQKRARIEPISKWFTEPFFETKSVVYLPVN